MSEKCMIFICLQTATIPLLMFLQCFPVKLESNSETLLLECLIAFFLLLLLFSGRATFNLHPSELVPRALTKALRPEKL